MARPKTYKDHYCVVAINRPTNTIDNNGNIAKAEPRFDTLTFKVIAKDKDECVNAILERAEICSYEVLTITFCVKQIECTYFSISGRYGNFETLKLDCRP